MTLRLTKPFSHPRGWTSHMHNVKRRMRTAGHRYYRTHAQPVCHVFDGTFAIPVFRR